METSLEVPLNDDCDVWRDHADKWPQLLADLVAVVEVGLTKAGATPQQAREFVIPVVLAIGEHMGGQMVYLPRGGRLVTALKHARAWRMWKGGNIQEIMAFLGVSQVRAYAVISQQRALHKAKRHAAPRTSDSSKE